MMNHMKNMEGCSFDQVITEVTQEGEYFTARVMLTLGSYLAGKDVFVAKATSRDRFKALGYALEEVSKQIQTTKRWAR